MTFAFPMFLPRPAGSAPPATFEAESEAIFAAFTSPPDDTRKGHIDTLVAALKAAGVWNDFDFLYVHAAADAQAARINWKNPGSLTATEVNSPTFTADEGYTGNGSSAYLDSGYNTSTGGGVYAQNSAHMGVFVLTSVTANSVDIGSGLNTYMSSGWSGPSIQGGVNGGVGGSNGTGSSVGHSCISRTGATLLRRFKNGSQLGSDVTDSSSAPPNSTARVLHAGIGGYSTRQIAISHLGAGLSDAKVAAVYAAFSTYLTAVGAI